MTKYAFISFDRENVNSTTITFGECEGPITEDIFKQLIIDLWCISAEDLEEHLNEPPIKTMFGCVGWDLESESYLLKEV